jgi:hypothetical protein
MLVHSNRTVLWFLILLSTVALATMTALARAEGPGMGHGATHRGEMAGGMHGKGKHGKGGRQHGQGDGERKGCSQHLFGASWRTTLSPPQTAALDKVHVTYAKNKAQLKALMQSIKVQLVVLATSDEPQTEATEAKIEELLAAKRELLLARYAYIAAQRALLTPDQQVSFDMEVIHKAMDGEKKSRHHHGGGH